MVSSAQGRENEQIILSHDDGYVGRSDGIGTAREPGFCFRQRLDCHG